MKIALIYPEVYDIARFGNKRKEFPPFGVLYLATIMNLQPRFEVEVFSVDNENSQLDLRAFSVVAFSIPSSVTYHIMKAARKNSVYASDVLLIAGGVHGSLFPAKTLLDLDVHAVGIGQGDETILELIAAKNTQVFSGIKGICYRQKEEALLTETRPLKNSLDHLPVVPNRTLLPDPDFIMSNRLAGTPLKMTHVMIAMGCPFSCHFCATKQKKMQYRSGQHIRQELIHLKSTYGIEGFAVVGDNFLVNKKRVLEICDAITDLDLKWSTLSRVDMVDLHTLTQMRDSGCIEIKFGIESGSQQILDAMGKEITLSQIYNGVRLAYSLGIGVKAFIIHGYPGENMETTQATIKMLDDLSSQISRVSLFRFVPLPGSAVHRGDDNLHLREDWKQCHIHHNPHHWWGTDEDFATMEASFQKLDEFILQKWG